MKNKVKPGKKTWFLMSLWLNWMKFSLVGGNKFSWVIFYSSGSFCYMEVYIYVYYMAIK